MIIYKGVPMDTVYISRLACAVQHAVCMYNIGTVCKKQFQVVETQTLIALSEPMLEESHFNFSSSRA